MATREYKSGIIDREFGTPYKDFGGMYQVVADAVDRFNDEFDSDVIRARRPILHRGGFFVGFHFPHGGVGFAQVDFDADGSPVGKRTSYSCVYGGRVDTVLVRSAIDWLIDWVLGETETATKFYKDTAESVTIAVALRKRYGKKCGWELAAKAAGINVSTVRDHREKPAIVEAADALAKEWDTGGLAIDVDDILIEVALNRLEQLKQSKKG